MILMYAMYIIYGIFIKRLHGGERVFHLLVGEGDGGIADARRSALQNSVGICAF
jgi:hypothetical protein